MSGVGGPVAPFAPAGGIAVSGVGAPVAPFAPAGGIAVSGGESSMDSAISADEDTHMKAVLNSSMAKDMAMAKTHTVLTECGLELFKVRSMGGETRSEGCQQVQGKLFPNCIAPLLGVEAGKNVV